MKHLRNNGKKLTDRIKMPKGIDPKAYAARITKAKKTIANTDPAVIKKINKMYPDVARTDSGVKTTTPTVNKMYRPLGK